MRNILSQFSSTPRLEIDDPMEAPRAEEAPMTPTDSAPTEPEQVAYVPAASRTTKNKVKKDKDEVVTVKKAKKRKAEVVAPVSETATAAPAEAEPSPPKRTKVNGEKTKGKKKAVKAEEVPDFDYSQEPNQLDTFAPESTTGKIKKQKKPKKREFCIQVDGFLSSSLNRDDSQSQPSSIRPLSANLLRIRRTSAQGTDHELSKSDRVSPVGFAPLYAYRRVVVQHICCFVYIMLGHQMSLGSVWRKIWLSGILVVTVHVHVGCVDECCIRGQSGFDRFQILQFATKFVAFAAKGRARSERSDTLGRPHHAGTARGLGNVPLQLGRMSFPPFDLRFEHQLGRQPGLSVT